MRNYSWFILTLPMLRETAAITVASSNWSYTVFEILTPPVPQLQAEKVDQSVNSQTVPTAELGFLLTLGNDRQLVAVSVSGDSTWSDISIFPHPATVANGLVFWNMYHMSTHMYFENSSVTNALVWPFARATHSTGYMHSSAAQQGVVGIVSVL